MSLIENIEAELGPLSEAERKLVERELDLLGAFAAGLVGRIPAGASKEEQRGVIAELLHEDAEPFAAFSQLMDVSESNRGSPLRSLHRLEREVEGEGDAP